VTAREDISDHALNFASDREPGPSKHRRATPGLPLPDPHKQLERARSVVRAPADDSLEIELPSFADDPSRRHLSPKKVKQAGPSTTGSRPHPTARTFVFDSDDSISGITRKRKPHQSKYFQSQDTSDNESDGNNAQDDDSDILIHASSPRRPSPTKRSRTNPFTTTREAHAVKTALKPKRKELEVIDLASSSPGTPLRPVQTNLPGGSPSRPKAKNSLAGFFSDVHGRPKKGLATGAKVKHRA
jgi:hypothetical protein